MCRRHRRRRHRHRRFCRCCGVVGFLSGGPLNYSYLISPSISTPGTFSTQILRLIIPYVY